MARKYIAFILVIFASAAAALAQTPAPKKESERSAQILTLASDSPMGYLGVQTKEVNAENYASLGLTGVRGVAVESVMADSPAEKAQLQKGDVIVRFNGEEITSTRKLTRLIGEMAPDHQATVTVIRGGAERDVPVTIGKRPMPAMTEGSWTMAMPEGGMPMPLPELWGTPGARPMPRGEGMNAVPFRIMNQRRIGVSITPLTKQLAENFGVKGGVMISEVRENSPAAKANLKAGDIITEVDGTEVSNEAEVVSAISAKKEGEVSLTIVRKGDRQTVRVTPEESKETFDRLIGPDSPMIYRPTRPAAPSAPMRLFGPWTFIDWPRRSQGRAIIGPWF